MTSEEVEQIGGRSAASHLQIEPYLASLASGFIDGVARLVPDEVAGYPARLLDVVTSLSDRLEMDCSSTVELLHAAE